MLLMQLLLQDHIFQSYVFPQTDQIQDIHYIVGINVGVVGNDFFLYADQVLPQPDKITDVHVSVSVGVVLWEMVR